jgi:hypothetical protein|tara:strand:+ start:163 stop:594 length:432 start_codon:yes stop_codon:yes gene_type:complete
MKVFFLLLFSLFLIPFTNLATADHTGDVVTSFVQIFHRDNDGNLIGYLEYTNHVVIKNAYAFDHLLTYQSNTVSLVEVNGKQFELISFITDAAPDESGLVSTTNISAMGNDGNLYKGMSIIHDGMTLLPDEKIDVIWTFLRPV